MTTSPEQPGTQPEPADSGEPVPPQQPLPPPGNPPPPSYPPPGYPPLGVPPQGMPPQGMPPPSYSGQPAGPPGYPSAPPPSPGYGYGQQPPAMPSGTYWEARHEVAVPNGTTLASRGRRIGAWFLAIPLLIVTLVIGYLIWGLIVWGRGQTPAFQVLRMRCWRMEDSKVASWGQMALREVVGRFLLSIIPFEQIVSFVVFLATKQRRAIHDYVAGTIVVHDPTRVLAQK